VSGVYRGTGLRGDTLSLRPGAEEEEEEEEVEVQEQVTRGCEE